LLDAGGPQTGKTVAINGTLPIKEFVSGQPVAIAGFFKRQQVHPERRRRFRLCDELPSVSFPVLEDRQVSAGYHQGR
jgi:hypothetical protein